MNSGATRYLQRGAILGLALLFSVQALGHDELRRELRGQSYILIEHGEDYRVLILGTGDEPARVIHVSPDDRAERLVELVDNNDPYATSALVIALDDPSPEVRSAAVTLLAEIDSVEARLALRALLSHPDAGLRLEVVEAVADAPGADDLLRMAAGNEAESVATTAREYLAERIADNQRTYE